MKKSRLLVVGLIALLMAGGLVLVGCGPKCSKDGNCYYNLITDDFEWCGDKACAVAASETATRCDCK